jgi:hypothetical protein
LASSAALSRLSSLLSITHGSWLVDRGSPLPGINTIAAIGHVAGSPGSCKRRVELGSGFWTRRVLVDGLPLRRGSSSRSRFYKRTKDWQWLHTGSGDWTDLNGRRRAMKAASAVIEFLLQSLGTISGSTSLP